MTLNMIKFSKTAAISVLLITAIFIAGCVKSKTASKSANNNSSESSARSSQSKWITDISFGNDAENFNIFVKGNRMLPYTTVKQVSPAAVFLYFTDTALDTSKTDLVVNNDIVEAIRASDVAEKGREAVKVEIVLKKNFPTTLPYVISREGPGVKISFKRIGGASTVSDDQNDTGRPGSTGDGTETRSGVSSSDTPPLRPVSTTPATRLDAVYAARIDDGLKVFVGADGMITKYKTSTTANPPRIIFDISDLKSPYTHEKVIPVNTPWVKMVRYQSYSDRINLILETSPQYLNAYSATPVDNGLMIHVGQTGAFPNRTQPSVAEAPGNFQFNRDSARPIGTGEPSEGDKNFTSYKTSAPQSAPMENGETDYTKPAYINQIDFLSEGAGRTALVIEASRPIKYEVSKAGDKKLEFKLFNTQIPDDLQREMSAKTDSPITRINPQKSGAANAAINIEMREDATYTADQDGNRLKLHLASASAPPVQETAASEPVRTPGTDETSGSVQAQASKFQVQPLSSQPPVQQSYTPPVQPMQTQPTTAQPYIPPMPDMGKTVASAKDLDLKSDTKLNLKEDAAPRYTGEKIALDFYDTDIKNVFRILREVGNVNFAVDKDVTGKVTLTLAEPVAWDQVLDLVLKMNKLGKTVDGNVIRIATNKTLEEEEKTRQSMKKLAMEGVKEKRQLEPFITEYISVNYSDAEKEVLPHIKEVLTKDRGDSKEKATVSVDKRTNMVIITDTAEVVKRAKELIEKLDRVTPQVVIEARIVEATANFSREIGTQWGSNIGIQNTDANAGIGPEKGYSTFGGTYGYNMAVNLPLTSTAGSLGFNFMRIAGTPFSLDAKLLAMETKGEGKVISSPKVLTLDNKKATIKQGLRYPYNKLDSSGNTTTVFEDVDLALEVTPHVTPDNRISMNISIFKKDIGTKVDAGYTFTNKEAKTELLINDGETVVIGGVTKQTEKLGNSGVPGLSKIPILGWLFKSKTDEDLKEELLIFITPRIVQLEQRAVQN
jgi:type IV pilus assembly protein PilQ